MRKYEVIQHESNSIFNHFSKVSKEKARNATEQWDISEARTQSGTLAVNLEHISENIDTYTHEELSEMIYAISKAQREIFKLI